MDCRNFKGYRCNVERQKTQVRQKNSLGETGTELCKKRCESNPDCRGFYTRIPKGYKRNTMCYLCTGEPNIDKSFRRSSGVKDFNICQRSLSASPPPDQDLQEKIERLEEELRVKNILIGELKNDCYTREDCSSIISCTGSGDTGGTGQGNGSGNTGGTGQGNGSGNTGGTGQGNGSGNTTDGSSGGDSGPSVDTSGFPTAVTIWTDSRHSHSNIISRVGFVYNDSGIVMDNALNKIGSGLETYNYNTGTKIIKELPPGSRITKLIVQQGWGLDCINFYTQKRVDDPPPPGLPMLEAPVATKLKHPGTNSGGSRYLFESNYNDPIVNIKRRMGENVSLNISQRDFKWWGGPIQYVITKSGKHIYPTILSNNWMRWCQTGN